MEIEEKGLTGFKLIQRIESDALPNEEEIAKLKTEISDYLMTMVEDNLRKFVLKMNRADQLSSSTTEFFRKRNRYRATKKLLQYLIRIIDDLPKRDLGSSINVDHFYEFKKLVLFQSELMQEEDVVSAMENEFGEMSREKRVNLWYYRGQIRSASNEITELIRQAEKPDAVDYQKLFKALSRISSFWFYARGDDESRIRITDIYIYKLLRILISRFPE